MNQLEFTANSEAATRQFGEAIGKHLVGGSVLFLSGTLGTGKSRLVQAIGAGLGINPEHIQSPTFTLMTLHSGRLTLVHVDAYRIADSDEAEQLGLTDWLNAECVLAIEWADRIAEVLPKPDLRIAIEHVDRTKRKFELLGESTRGQQLLGQLQALGLFTDQVK